jgi:hypothetical protein
MPSLNYSKINELIADSIRCLENESNCIVSVDNIEYNASE